jgi:acetyltransferase-like isoleucine patch superfamily enzyme
VAAQAGLMRTSRLLSQLWPWRWSRALVAALRGVRVHPSVTWLGASNQFDIGRGTALGARVRLDVGDAGRLFTGARVWLAADNEVETTTAVRIGEGTTLQRRCSVNGTVRIGRGCIFAPNVFISSGTHPFRVVPHLPIRQQERLAQATDASDHPVWIQDDCWLGANVVVCPGVTIGKGSVVGANAVVTRSVPPYSVVAGAPARTIGQRLQWSPPTTLSADRPEDLPYVLAGQRPPQAGASQPTIEISVDEPLQVVMSAAAASIDIELLAQHPVELRVLDALHRVGPGPAQITVDAAVLPRRHGGILIEVSLHGGPSAPNVTVSRLLAR